MKNSHKPRGTYADYLNGNIEDKIFVFQLAKDNRNNQTMTTDTGAPIPFPLSVSFPMVGTIYEKNEKGVVSPRKIRYIEGEPSIYVDQQTPDKDVPKTLVRKAFVRGRAQVDGRDSVQLEFMMKWDINGSNPKRNDKKVIKFNLVDTSKMVAKARQADKAKYDVAKWCMDGEFEKVKAVASLKLSDEQMVQSSEDIRWNLKLVAENNPEEFLKMLENPSTERRFIMMKAIDKGIVSVNVQLNAMCWSDNLNNPMTVAPEGKNILEDFIVKSFSTDGERYFRAIEDLVMPKEKPEVKQPLAETNQTNDVSPIVKPAVQGTGIADSELEILINAGLEKKVITITANTLWWKYREQSFKQKEGFMQGLRDNAIMLSLLQKDVL